MVLVAVVRDKAKAFKSIPSTLGAIATYVNLAIIMTNKKIVAILDILIILKVLLFLFTFSSPILILPQLYYHFDMLIHIL